MQDLFEVVMDEVSWKRRFRAVELGLPRWSDAAPERLAYVSNESGIKQVWALDRANGQRHQVSYERLGTAQVLVAPDGRILWWSDPTGDERGRWVAVGFEGGDPQPLLSDLPDGWPMGVSLAGGSVAVGLATDDAYHIYVAEPDVPTRVLARHDTPAGVGRDWPEGTGGLSPDGSLVCVHHADNGDLFHPALRVVEVATGETVGELKDPGRGLDAVGWAPGGRSLLVMSERGAFERPAIWDPSTGERRDLVVDLPGGLLPLCWYPDGSAVLVRQEHDAVDRLHRIEVRTGHATLVADPGGEIGDAAVRPDGEVWLIVSDTTHPSRPETSDGRPVLEVPGGLPPTGAPYRFFWFTNPPGERIQAFVATPPGEGPFPIVMHAHGGPGWHHRASWEPEIQALVDAGFAVAGVNYRGSTGYGIAFRERLYGDPILPETEDILACLDALIAEGAADAGAAFFAGWSWGGHLACLNEGLHPDRWRAVFAGVPVGDLVASHWAAMPVMQAMDLVMFGGDPDRVPDLYRERDPMTYVDRAKAPVLVIAGEQDPRCPLEGVTPWVDALRARGVEVQVSLHPAGHETNDREQEIRDVETMLAFFERHRRQTSRPSK